jgi:hypothetical protein
MSDDPAWPLVQEWAENAVNPHRLLPADDAEGRATLDSLDGITEWSVLGALARNAAALVVDDWLVVLGAGGGGYPGLRELNDEIEWALVVALDVVGGGFAISGGGLGCGEPGEVCYLAPDTLEWMDTGLGHAAFVHWTLHGPIDQFYEDLRWPGWREDVAALNRGQGIYSYPPPWSAEGRGADVHRGAVPLAEAWDAVLSTARQIGSA